MNDSKDILSLPEVETLCRLYMDCKLSVLEETELEYVLSRMDFDSPLIDETRKVMGLSRKANLAPQVSAPKPRARMWWCGVAASIALLVGAIGFLHKSDRCDVNDNNVYIAAYCNGKELSGPEAAAYVREAIAKADSLMNHAAFVEEQNLRNTELIISQTYK